MPGFVDVSNMTSEEVRRMGHADDYDKPQTFNRNPYAYRKPVKKAPKVTFNYNADDVWSAAVQAQSINGSYVKALGPGLENHKTNRQIIDSLLADVNQITQESRDKANDVRKYFQAFTFKILQGKPLNEFNNTAMLISNKEVIDSNYDIAVIASLPQSYDKGVKRDDVDRRINFARGGYIGVPGDKIKTEIEILKKFWSQNWNTWYVTGITDSDNVLFFAYQHETKIGDRVTIQGVVKQHRDNLTQLNRVKVV